MITKKILEIAKILEKYGQTILKSATKEEIDNFQKWIVSKYDDVDVSEYISLVKLVNGMDFNGLVIYSIKNESEESIYNSNEIWSENGNLENYLIFADSDIAWYCLDFPHKQFCELDKPSGEVMRTYKTFNEMINVALDYVM